MLWVLFVFLSYQDRNVVKGKLLNDAHGAENESKDAWFTVNRTLCAKMSVLAGGLDSLYQVSDGRREVRSVVNTRGDLMDCSVIVDRVQVKSFLHLCRLGLTQQDFHGEHLSANNRFVRMEEAMAACGEFTQRSELMERRAQSTKTQPWPRRDAPLKRSKRGFTYPGTLWCGAGNMADNDDHLGDFAETDSCCRTHDHCPHVIHAFSSNYGYTNFKLHSISHCDCDIAMKQCLRKVNDTASRVVGQAFFNVIGAPCFEFVYEDHCAERHWYGLCKRYERLPVAVPQPAVVYDFGGVDIIDVLTVAPPAKTNTAKADDDGRAGRESTAAPGTAAGGSSLVTMVTAAEDFIKVLATVSTSQGSPADAAKGAAPGAQAKKTTKKKKKGNPKNSEKRKMSQSQGKRKGKGRGRKGKPHPDSGPERALGASSRKAGAGGSSLAELKTGPSGQRNHHTFGEGGLDLAGLGGPSNEVMKDEPAAERDAAEATSLPAAAAAPKRQAARPAGLAALCPGSARLTASTGPTAAVPPPPPRSTRPLTARKGERRRRKKTPGRDRCSPPGSAADVAPRENPSGVGSVGASASPGAAVAVNAAARLGQQRSGARPESESSLAVNRPKKNRSREGTVGRRRKKGRRLAAVAAIVPADHKVPTESGNAAGGTAVPIAPSAPPTERPSASRRPETYGAQSATGVTPAPSRSAVKTKGQRSKGPGRQRQRGKPALSPFHGNTLLQESPERAAPAGINALFRMRATATTAAATTTATATTTAAVAVARPSKQVQHSGGRGERQRGGAGASPAFSAATQRPTERKGDATRKKRPRCPAPCEAPRAPGTLTAAGGPTAAPAAHRQEKSVQAAGNSSFAATASAPPPSPMQRSIQRVQQQFDFKRRRKELLLLRRP